MRWRDHLGIHPAAYLFPPMSKEELRELGDDIARHGLRAPIVVCSNSDDDKPCEKLLDGLNRLDAAEQAGLLSVDDGELRIRHPSGDYIPIPKSYSREDDPFALVISMNIHRRHLKSEKRKDLLIKLIARNPGRSNRQIAKEAGVSRKAVDRARAKGEDVGHLAHVSRRLDSTGRSQPPKGKTKSNSVIAAEAVMGRSEKALADFKYAVETYLPRMSSNDLKAAHRHFNAVWGRERGRIDGAATSEQLRLYP